MEQKNIITKWISLGYISFFIISIYLLLQFLFTALLVFYYEIHFNHVDRVRIKGYKLELDGVRMNIWQLPEFYLAMILSAFLVFVLVHFILKRQKISHPNKYLGFHQIGRNHLLWLLYSAAFALFCYTFWYIIGLNSGLIRLPNSTYELLMVFFGAVVCAPVIEEVIFRGLILKKMNELLDNELRWISVIVTAFLFAIIHFQFSIPNLAFLFTVGVFLAIMKLKTENLWFPIIFHSVGNLITLILFYIL